MSTAMTTNTVLSGTTPAMPDPNASASTPQSAVLNPPQTTTTTTTTTSTIPTPSFGSTMSSAANDPMTPHTHLAGHFPPSAHFQFGGRQSEFAQSNQIDPRQAAQVQIEQEQGLENDSDIENDNEESPESSRRLPDRGGDHNIHNIEQSEKAEPRVILEGKEPRQPRGDSFEADIVNPNINNAQLAAKLAASRVPARESTEGPDRANQPTHFADIHVSLQEGEQDPRARRGARAERDSQAFNLSGESSFGIPVELMGQLLGKLAGPMGVEEGSSKKKIAETKEATAPAAAADAAKLATAGNTNWFYASWMKVYDFFKGCAVSVWKFFENIAAWLRNTFPWLCCCLGKAATPPVDQAKELLTKLNAVYGAMTAKESKEDHIKAAIAALPEKAQKEIQENKKLGDSPAERVANLVAFLKDQAQLQAYLVLAQDEKSTKKQLEDALGALGEDTMGRIVTGVATALELKGRNAHEKAGNTIEANPKGKELVAVCAKLLADGKEIVAKLYA